MIVLDANTAIRSFLDGKWDLDAIAEALNRLIAETGIIRVKYADGKIQPVPTAAFIKALVPNFPKLDLNGVVLEIDNGLKITAEGLSAAFESPRLEYSGDDVARIEGSHIKSLIVNGLLTIGDGQFFEGRYVRAITALNAALNNAAFDSADIGALLETFGDDSQYLDDVSTASLYYPGDNRTQVAIYPNKFDPLVYGSETSPLYLGRPNSSRGPAEAIHLTADDILVLFPALGVRASGDIYFNYSVPYWDGESFQYYKAGTTGRYLQSTPITAAAPNGMADFLIWPCWEAYGHRSTNELAISSTCTIRYIADDSVPYISLVHNDTDGDIYVANVWDLGRTPDASDPSGYRATVTARHKVKLPPRSSVEFVFSYDKNTNSAYMFPMRALNG